MAQQQNASPAIRRLKDYSLGAAAIATGAFGLVSQDASAAIVQFSDSGSIGMHNFRSLSNVNLPDSYYLSISTFRNSLYLGNYYGLWDNTGPAVGDSSHYSVALRVLGPNTAINPTTANVYDPSSAVGMVSGVKQSGWTTSFNDQYVGFVDGLGHMGYLKVSWDATTEVFSWNGGAIEDSGGPLSTPGGVPPAAVPEPGSLALLVVGAVGLARRRRKTH